MGIEQATTYLALTLAAYTALIFLKNRLFMTKVNKRRLTGTLLDLSAGYIGTYTCIYFLNWEGLESIVLVIACWMPIRLILQRKVLRRIKECLRPEIRRASPDTIPGTGETPQ